MTIIVDCMDWDWQAHITRRWDRQGLIEHVCPHGIGHPNRGSAMWIVQAQFAQDGMIYEHCPILSSEESDIVSDFIYTKEDMMEEWAAQMIHGCDGCCRDSDFPDFMDSLAIAHSLSLFKVALAD